MPSACHPTLIAEFILTFHYINNGSNQTLSSSGSCFHSLSCRCRSSCFSTRCYSSVSFYMACFMITHTFDQCSVTPSSGLANSGDADYSLVPRSLSAKPAPKTKGTPGSPSTSSRLKKHIDKNLNKVDASAQRVDVLRQSNGQNGYGSPAYVSKLSTLQHPLQY